MASCKDCLHVDVCCSYLSTAYNKCKLATPDFKLLKNIECDECQHFKDRSRFVELPTHLNVSERFEKCSQELINIAKCSETPSQILRIIGENFTELANGFEKIEQQTEQALKEREENA